MSLAVRVPVYRATSGLDSTLVPLDSTVVPETRATPLSLDTISVHNISPQPVDVEKPKQPMSTKFTLAAGGGRYIREVLLPLGTECSSVPPATFESEYIDVGGEIDRQVSRLGHIGIRGGYINETIQLVADIDTMAAGLETSGDEDTYYVNPYFGFEWTNFGFGAGVLLTSRDLNTGDESDDPFEDDGGAYPTAHIRFGPLSKFYLSGHLFEGVPIYSGGGLLMAGMGIRAGNSLELYGGYCSESPYMDDSFLGRVSLDINRSWTLLTTIRFPTDFSNSSGAFEESEYGASVGVSYRVNEMR